MAVLWEYAKVFLVGGALCVIGQLLIDYTRLTPARILTGFVVAGVILGALGIYGPLAEWAGAGATVCLAFSPGAFRPRQGDSARRYSLGCWRRFWESRRTKTSNMRIKGAVSNAVRRIKRRRGSYQPPGRAGLKQHKNVRRIRTYLRIRLTFLTF